MKIGYARVSTQEQKTDAQREALLAAGAERIFEEKASGGKWERPELHRLLDHLRPGDTLVVWKLDRLSRSLKDLLTILETLDKQGIGFESVTERIDTTTPAGRAMMQMVGVFAEFERAMIRERVQTGVDRARDEGRVGGRPRSLSEDQKREAVRLLVEGRKSQAAIARLFEVHPSTITRLKTSA